MKKMLLLFNHTLTDSQEQDARISLGVAAFVSPPREISELWSSLPADAGSLAPLLQPLFQWLDDQGRAGDYVLVQGDFGACYLVVRYCLEHGLVPVYATTRRAVSEHTTADGEVHTTRVFKHVMFRRYGE